MNTLQYFLRRIFVSIIVFFGVSIVIFCLARLIPGDPARIALGPFATDEMVEQLRETLHLNESIFIQYGIFIEKLAEFTWSSYSAIILTLSKNTAFIASCQLHKDKGK